ncbi:MAG: hypothetical protein ABSH45_03850 [Bryobacteraceae bacterium]|jgi:hypothetical protein
MFRICSFVLLVSSLFAEQADWIWSARYVITEDAGHLPDAILAPL